MRKLNLLNQKFGRLLVIAAAEPTGKNKLNAWLCQCDCGNTKIIAGSNLTRKNNRSTKSCGCLSIEKSKERGSEISKSLIKYHPKEATARSIWQKKYSDGYVSFDDFYKLSQQNCFYCGALPSNKHNSANQSKSASKFKLQEGYFIYNGLDRIDSNKGHLLDNVVPCCKWCNYAKRERTTEDFFKWLKNAYEHNFPADEPKITCK